MRIASRPSRGGRIDPNETRWVIADLLGLPTGQDTHDEVVEAVRELIRDRDRLVNEPKGLSAGSG